VHRDWKVEATKKYKNRLTHPSQPNSSKSLPTCMIKQRFAGHILIGDTEEYPSNNGFSGLIVKKRKAEGVLSLRFPWLWAPAFCRKLGSGLDVAD
jgi:hypothetical protein